MKTTALALALVLIGSACARAQEAGHEGHDHAHSHAPGQPPAGPPAGGPSAAPPMEPPTGEEKAVLERLSTLKSQEPKNEAEEKKLRESYAEVLHELVFKFPDSPRAPFALEALLKLHVNAHQAEKALDAAQKYVEKTTKAGHKAFGQQQVVAVYRHSGQQGKAVSYATERANAAAGSPQAEWFLFEAANILAERGKYDDAVALLSGYLAKNPNAPSAARLSLRAGDLLISAAKPEAALEKFKGIDPAKLKPGDAGMQLHLTAMAYMGMARQTVGDAAAKHRKAALDTITPVLEKARKDPANADPFAATAFTAAADIALAGNDVPGAIKIYEEMARLFKNKPAGAYAERAARDATLIGTKLSGASGPTIAGKNVDAKEFAGKILLVDFFTLSNPEYGADVGLLKRLVEKLSGKKFAILGVNLDKKEQSDTVKRFIEDRKIGWPVIFEGQGPMSAVAVSNSVSRPMNFVVDEEGTILRVALTGPHLEDTVIQEVARLEKGLPSPVKPTKPPKK